VRGKQTRTHHVYGTLRGKGNSGIGSGEKMWPPRKLRETKRKRWPRRKNPRLLRCETKGGRCVGDNKGKGNQKNKT